MKTIWKFPVEAAEPCVISMPKGAEILTVQTQNNNPCMWAVVAPGAEKEDRTFIVRGTGHDVTDHRIRYIGTFQLNNGTLVFHVFEV